MEEKEAFVAGYVRVSTHYQSDEGDSLDEQEKQIRRYCEFKEWNKLTFYREEGVSAKDTNRIKLQQLIKDIKDGKINTVIVKKIDRLSRSILDFEQLFKLFDQYNVDLISLQENFDTTSATGRAIIRIILVFAQLEREQTSERTADVMEFRAQEGLWNGGTPFLGYDFNPDEEIPKVIEEEAELVAEAFRLYIEKGSTSEVATILNNKGYRNKTWVNKKGEKRGGNKFDKFSIISLLKREFYIGKIRHKDNLYDGKQQAIIDVQTFEIAQKILEKNTQIKGNVYQDKYDFILQGLLYCGHCHKAMTPSSAISKGKTYLYYRCLNDNDKSKQKCPIGHVNAREIENLVIERLRFLSQDQELLVEIIEQSIASSKTEIKPLEKERKSLEGQLTKIQQKINNLVVMVEDGANNSQALVERLKELEAQKSQIGKSIAEIGFKINALESKMISQDVVMLNLQFFYESFSELSTNEKKEFLRTLIKEIIFEGFENDEPQENGNGGKSGNGNGNGKLKKGKIKMGLWDIPPIDPSMLHSASFAESAFQLPVSVSQSLILWDAVKLEMEKVIKGHTKITILQ